MILRDRDDDGSTMVLAVVVMMMLTTLTLALQARTMASLTSMRAAQDFDAALAAADAGLARAVYRIENGQLSDFAETGETGAGAYAYEARVEGALPPKSFVVSVRGQVGDGRKAIRALVTRSALFPYALFGFESLTVDGSTAVGSMMHFSTSAGVDTTGSGVFVGSNGMLTCRGTAPTNVAFRSAGGFSGCPSTQWEALDHEEPRLDITSPPSPNRACPTDGRTFGTTANATFALDTAIRINAAVGNLFSTEIAAAQALLQSTVALPVQVISGAGGPFVCRQDVSLRGIVEVTGPDPVQIYVLKDSSGACHTLDLTNAVINATSATTGGVLRRSRDFQLYKDGSCALRVGTGNTSDTLSFNGILYAPDSVMTVTGGKSFQGAVMVGQVKVNGGPNLYLKYDGDLRTYYGNKWRVSRYAEVPNTELTFTGP